MLFFLFNNFKLLIMKFDLSKEDIINMVKGVSPKSMEDCVNYTNSGLMKFTGNQWNENWDWVVSELQSKSEEELFNLYLKHK